MKIIRLTDQQRHEIDERRRQTQDRRIYQRLSAVLWIDAGRTREEVAELSGVSTRQVGQWLRIFRNKGLDALCTLHYRGDPGRLRPAQVGRLKQEIAKGAFHNADQVRAWIQEQFGVAYSPSGVKDLLRRIGASYHKVSGFFWKADRDEQRAFVRKYRRHRRQAGPGTRRYFVDACHPVWGLELLYCCWLLVGQRYYVGVGNGRKRLNILGAYCPDDHDYVDLRLTRENITGEQFVKLLEKMLAKHPETEKFILYLDNARYTNVERVLPRQCEVLQQAGGEGVAVPASSVPPGVPAGLLAQLEPDRAAVEVPAEEGAEPLARDVRGDAGCGGRGAGSSRSPPPGIGQPDDRGVPHPRG
jgi:transposase